MKPLKRTLINYIIFIIAYAGVTYAMTRALDIATFIIISVVYLVVNYVIYSILDKVSK